jgi:hypothetical protein
MWVMFIHKLGFKLVASIYFCNHYSITKLISITEYVLKVSTYMYRYLKK